MMTVQTMTPTGVADLLDALAAMPPDWHAAGSLEMPNLAALAKHAAARKIRCSMETGAGKTTLLMSHFSRRHLVFSLDLGHSLSVARHSELLREGSVEFIDGPSQHTLMGHTFSEPMQLAIIDGPHGYPFPQMEYWKIYPHLEAGALLVIDDIHIPTIRQLFDFLSEDSMFTLLEVVGKTAFFERTSAPTFSPTEDGWWLQAYNTRRFPAPYPSVTSDWSFLNAVGQEFDAAAYRSRLLPLIGYWARERIRVAIFGIGEHTDRMLQAVPELRDCVSGFLDTNLQHHGTAYQGTTVHPPSWATGNVDVILCSSFKHEMKQLQLLDDVPVKVVLSHTPTA